MEIAFKPHATLLMQKCIETSQLTASHFKEMKFSYDQCIDLVKISFSHIFYRN